ncbi:heavy-metal-associated domain-containing protein [Benzoatithermus flavus]|uniref:Cation transporter n=1 Tax=Benzoatithermus flavus TaxID=3108223 RepID=A0ABU8XZ64_9PROT
MSGEQQATRTIRLEVEGMGCAGCVTAVRQALEDVPGVVRALIELEGGWAEVEASPTVDPARLVAAIDAAGYEARLARGGPVP